MGFFGDQGMNQQQGGYYEEPPSDTNDRMAFGVAQQQSTEMVKYIMGKTDLLSQLESYLRGFVPIIDDDGNEGYGPDPKGLRKPLMNEKGITVILGLAMPLVEGKTIEISDFTEQHIKNMMVVWGDGLVDNLFSNSEEYEIEQSQIEMIYWTIFMMVWSSLRKSEGGKMRSFYKDNMQRTEIRNLQTKKGTFSKLFK